MRSQLPKSHKKLTNNTFSFNSSIIVIGLIGKAKIRLSETWQRMRFLVIFRLHGKGHKKFKCLNKIDVTRSIRNISSQELHSALGKISVVNFMYSLLRQKNYYIPKI
jgi:hypothetical protein